jgi:hypothetical protein
MTTLHRATTDMAEGLKRGWRDLVRGRALSFASPLLAFPLAYIAAYGVGWFLFLPRSGTTLVAIVVGLIAFLAGLGWTLRRPLREEQPIRTARSDVLLLRIGIVLVALGVLGSIAYLWAIGGIPLFMDSVEEARVQAADRGGAYLRVASMLGMLGVWLLAAYAARGHRLFHLLGVGVLTLLIAFTQLATGNRAPAFATVEVAALTAILASGTLRLTLPPLLLLMAGLLVLVGLAGAIGGYRFSHTPATWRDPDIADAVAAGDAPALVLKGLENYLIVPVQNFRTTMAAVPDLIGWRFGSTYLQPLSTMLPGHQTTFDQDLKEALQQQYAGGGTAPTMLGEAYANFGPLGWLAIPALIGMALGFLYRFAREQRTAAAWVLYAYVLLHLANSTVGGIMVANVVPVFMLVILIAIAFYEPMRARLATHRLGSTAPLAH